MTEEQYITRHHQLPLVRVGGRIAVVVAETSEWFRRSIQPHLQEGTPVRVDAAPGYAYSLQARGLDREPVLAVRITLGWHSGRLWLARARGTDGQLIDLPALFKVQSLEEIAADALRRPAEDTALSKSGLHPKVQSQLAETARCESALRRALLSGVQNAHADAMCLCVKLLGTSFGGYDPNADLYQQAAAKLATVPYAPHLRDLLTTLISSPLPGALQHAAKSFCHHLHEAGIEETWVTGLLNPA